MSSAESGEANRQAKGGLAYAGGPWALPAPSLPAGWLTGRWGQVYMTEALTTLLDWSLSQPEIWRASAFCDAENLASARGHGKGRHDLRGHAPPVPRSPEHLVRAARLPGLCQGQAVAIASIARPSSPSGGATWSSRSTVGARSTARASPVIAGTFGPMAHRRDSIVWSPVRG